MKLQPDKSDTQNIRGYGPGWIAVNNDKLFTSLVARDWPVVFPILMFGAAITVFSYILTDVIYKWADPRVKSLET